MTTEVLLLAGVVAVAVWVAVVLTEGSLRPGYDATYHTASELELGERGWIQRVNFMLMGVGVLAFAVGVMRTLDNGLGAALFAIFGVGSIVSGVFIPDAIRGYPPGARSELSAQKTWRAQVHDVAGPAMFLALFLACLTLAGPLQGGWRLYTALTAAAGLALTIWTALSYRKDARILGLVQRGMLLVYLSWIALLGVHLVAAAAQA